MHCMFNIHNDIDVVHNNNRNFILEMKNPESFFFLFRFFSLFFLSVLLFKTRRRRRQNESSSCNRNIGRGVMKFPLFDLHKNVSLCNDQC